MADTIGMYMNQTKHSEEPAAPIQPAPALSVPAPIPPVQPPPPLTSPDPIHPLEPAPPLTTPDEVKFQPAPPLSVTGSVPFMPNPPLSITGTVPFMPAPPPTEPDVIPFMPAPALSTTGSVPFMAAPPLSTPGQLPEMLPPPLRVTGTVQFQTPPPLRTTGTVGFQATPDLRVTGTVKHDVKPELDKVHPPTAWYETPYASGTRHMHPGKNPGELDYRVPQYPPDMSIDDQPAGEPRLHSNMVQAAEEHGAFMPGFVTETAGKTLDMIKNLHAEVEIAGFNAGYSVGGGFGTDFDAKQIANNVRDLALTYAKAKAQAAIKTGVNAVVGTVKTALFGPPAPPDPNAPSPTVLPDLEVYPADYVHDYVQASRMNTQEVQQKAADQANAISYGSYDLYNVYNDNRNAASRFFERNPDQMSISTLFDVNIPATKGPRGVEMTRKKNMTPYSAASSYFTTEEKYGYVTTEISDKDTYFPLVFTDTRKAPGSDMKMVYFEPYITNLSEAIAPNWSLQNYFGRVDPVAGYQGTNRTVSLGFKLVAMSKDELKLIFQKLAWLSSMCYPSVRDEMYYSGPIVRMRVGDVINAIGRDGVRGLPGVIMNLDVNYDQSVWEIEAGSKLPMNVDVSLTFQVLHDTFIGTDVDTGMFGGSKSAEISPKVASFRAAFGGAQQEEYIGGTPPDMTPAPMDLPDSEALAGPVNLSDIGTVEQLGAASSTTPTFAEIPDVPGNVKGL